jgi:hypothetical protein
LLLDRILPVGEAMFSTPYVSSDIVPGSNLYYGLAKFNERPFGFSEMTPQFLSGKP